MASRTSWNQIRERRLAKPAARAGYDRARRAFELGEEVRRLREAAGLSQMELARRIRSTQPAIARLEAGGVAPTIETLERIAAALGLDLAVSFKRRKQPA
jgi:ribosome-binding protein aMBF1 (putative translation factor)